MREAHIHLSGTVRRAWEAHLPRGLSTDEQPGRRPIFGETLRAEVLLPLRFVAPPSQIPADMLRRRTEQQISLAASRAKPTFLLAAVSIVF